MRTTWARGGTGVLLSVSGFLLVVASWQRWASACPWGEGWETTSCLPRQDHHHDFLPPLAPWVPVGTEAQWGGVSLLVLALALVFLPSALTRSPGRLMVLVAVLSAVATADVGLAALRSGMGGEVVPPAGGLLTVVVAGLLTMVLYVWLAVVASGWDKPAALLLVLSSPPVALLYAVGPYDAQPWSEAVAGAFVLLAGAWLVARTVRLPSSREVPSQAYEGVPTS